MNHKDVNAEDQDPWRAPWEADDPNAWTHAQKMEGKRKYYDTLDYLCSIRADTPRMIRFVQLFGYGMNTSSYSNWLNRMTVWVAAAENEIKRKNMLREPLTGTNDQPTI